jgi:hypothetical protein
MLNLERHENNCVFTFHLFLTLIVQSSPWLKKATFLIYHHYEACYVSIFKYIN